MTAPDPDADAAPTEEETTKEEKEGLFWAANTGNTTVILGLLKDKNEAHIAALLKEKDKNGWTALMGAATYGYTETVQALLDAGADPNVQNRNGLTALIVAAAAGRTEVVTLLLEKGAKPDVQDKKGWTALMLAAFRGHIEVVRALINAGADPDVRDNGGWTALMQAALHGHEGIARALIEKGAKPNATTIGKYFFFINMEEVEIPPGSTARDIARIARHPEVADLLPATAAQGGPAPAP